MAVVRAFARALLPSALLAMLLTSCQHRHLPGATLPAPGDYTSSPAGVGAAWTAPPEPASVVPTTIEQLFLGRFPGLDMYRTANGAVVLSLRGRNPLLVVDGVPADPVIFATIRPDEVRTIRVLRSGSEAAVYGPRGANGAVVVTTDRGRR